MFSLQGDTGRAILPIPSPYHSFFPSLVKKHGFFSNPLSLFYLLHTYLYCYFVFFPIRNYDSGFNADGQALDICFTSNNQSVLLTM